MLPSIPYPRARLRDDRCGAIEGLPLYLIIIIVITVVGLGIVLAMLNAVQPPNYIDKVIVTPDTIEATDPDGDETYTAAHKGVTVKVVDTNGDPVKGAMVRLTGCNVKEGGKTAYGKTDSKGEIMFSSLSCEVVGTDTGHIEIEVEKNDMGKKKAVLLVVPVSG